jgi:mannose-6-phosphate isomerase-like protein (cupin superfamily)
VSLIESSEGGILDSSRVLYTPAGGGDTTWVSGDIYRILASGEDGAGTVGFVDGVIPVGGGPIPHVHGHTDESFFLISGSLAFLGGQRNFTAAPGAFVHVPRGTLHRFMNVGDEEARLLLFFTPGGPELMFKYGGDKPQPGSAPVVWDADRVAEAVAATARLELEDVARPDLNHLFRPERDHG